MEGIAAVSVHKPPLLSKRGLQFFYVFVEVGIDAVKNAMLYSYGVDMIQSMDAVIQQLIIVNIFITGKHTSTK